MANKLKKVESIKIKGFSLVELLLALGIFAIVVSANFALVLDTYRARGNDRIRLEAGLVIKDTVNAVYSYKNSNWSEIIANLDVLSDGSSKKIELVQNQFQINPGTWTQGRVTYGIYISTASRVAGEINPESEGGDPDTIKITVTAMWTDVFNIEQSLSEDYYLTNWASQVWHETTDADFTTPVPTYFNTAVTGAGVEGRVNLTQGTSFANNDWCNFNESGDVSVTKINIFPTGSGNVSGLGSTTDGTVNYKVYEPIISGPLPTAKPAPGNPVLPILNNANPLICTGDNIPITQCEALIRFYRSTGGSAWSNKSGWSVIDQLNIENEEIIQISGSFERIIANSTDDARGTNTNTVTNESTITLNTTNRYGGLRFENITIPQGATITSATLSVYVPNASFRVFDETFFANNVANSPTFISGGTDLRFRARTSSSVYVNHDVGAIGWHTLNGNFTPLVQEVINRGDWIEGNAISILTDHGTTSSNTVRFRTIESADEFAPRLNLSYEYEGLASASDPCTWFGVSCVGENITGITLPSNNLSGSIPIEIGHLTNLNTFNLSNNGISGTLPPHLGLITNLGVLNLQNNEISGVIPKTIANNTSLTSINLSENQLEGQIPDTIANLTNLNSIILNNNNLTCHLPAEFATMSNLSIGGINLSFNNILLPSQNSAINDFLNSKSANYNSQSTVILHEDCVMSPGEDTLLMGQFNNTENDGNPFLYQYNLESSDFVPPISKSVQNYTAWNNNRTSNYLVFNKSQIANVDYNEYWNILDNDFTFSMWIYPITSQTNYAEILRFSNGGHNTITEGWVFSFLAPNMVHFKAPGSNPIALTNNTILQTAWYHITVTISNGVARLYYNGVEVANDTYSNLIPLTNTSEKLRIGNNPALNLGFDGRLDEVKIYRRALSIDEILKNMYIESSTRDTGLMGYWKFNLPSIDAVNQIAYDYSFQGNHAVFGTSVNPDAADPTLGIGSHGSNPSLDTGIVRYRVNDIYTSGDKSYISTSNPTMNVIIQDRTTSTFSVMNTELNNNFDTTGVVIEGNRGYIAQDKFLIQFDPSDNSIVNSINLQSNGGLGPIVDLNYDNNFLYLISTSINKNFGVMDIQNGIGPTPRTINLLLEAYL